MIDAVVLDHKLAVFLLLLIRLMFNIYVNWVFFLLNVILYVAPPERHFPQRTEGITTIPGDDC